MIRLGLCCMFHEYPIRFQSTTATSLRRMPRNQQLSKLSGICLHNAQSVLASLAYCHDCEIRSFRLSSNLFPLKTHPEVGYTYSDLAEWQAIQTTYGACKQFAQTHNIRLGLHPGQFTVLNSEDEHLTQNSIEDLQHHADIACMTGADTINIHVGGAYGDKRRALDQLARNLETLDDDIYSHLTFENDDRTFTVEDLYPFCYKHNIPMVYDVHHDRCNPGTVGVAEATEMALSTWQEREPLFHISSPLGSGRDQRSHADLIRSEDWPQEWNEGLGQFTVEVEAKHKEIAVCELQKDLTARCINWR